MISPSHLNESDPEGNHPLHGGCAARLDGEETHVEGKPHRINYDEQPGHVLGAPVDGGQDVLLAVVDDSALEKNLSFEKVQGVRLSALEQQRFLRNGRFS